MAIYQNPAGGQQTQVQPQQQQTMPGVQPLPATGIQQQAAGINQQQGFMAGQPQPVSGQLPMAQTSLTDLANKLARSYGLPVGRQGLVDQQGNFLMTPDQISQQSGGQIGMADAAAKMNYVAAALARQQQQQSQMRARGAIEAGMKLVQSRGRGSLAAMQSGMYQQLSQLYASEQHEAADFSYFIQQDRFNRAMREMRKQRKSAKKSRRLGLIGGALGMAFGGAIGGFAGAGLGGQLGGQAGGFV